MYRGKRNSTRVVEEYVHQHFHEWFKEYVRMYMYKSMCVCVYIYFFIQYTSPQLHTDLSIEVLTYFADIFSNAIYYTRNLSTL
jgi:hypothetical protein